MTFANDLPPLRSPNRKGDLGEATFVARALRMGFNVMRPINTNCQYDFVVEAAGKYSQVQVKSVWFTEPPYSFLARHGGRKTAGYAERGVQFIAAYVACRDAWYIIPAHAIEKRMSVVLNPHNGGRGLFEKYREAWHLMLPRRMKISDLRALADPEFNEAATPQR